MSFKAHPAVWLVLLRRLADNPSCAVIPAASGWKVGMHKSLKNIVVDIFKLPKLGEVLIFPKLGDVHDSKLVQILCWNNATERNATDFKDLERPSVQDKTFYFKKMYQLL